jgi:hypothetical protein
MVQAQELRLLYGPARLKILKNILLPRQHLKSNSSHLVVMQDDHKMMGLAQMNQILHDKAMVSLPD